MFLSVLPKMIFLAQQTAVDEGMYILFNATFVKTTFSGLLQVINVREGRIKMEHI